jgi:hypothetical protein
VTWQQALTDPNGLWGVDVLDSSHAWAVGVTSLYATTDGMAWSQLGEPDGTALVNVEFGTPEDGIGLTSGGTLVTTSNGGVAWSPVNGSPTGLSDTCRQADGSILVDDQVGDIWTVNLATTTVQSNAIFASHLPQGGSMAILSCGQGTSPWEEVAPNQPGGSPSVTVISGAGGSWNAAAVSYPPSGAGIGTVDRAPVVGAPEPLLTTRSPSGPTAGGIYQASIGASFVLVKTPHLFDGTVPTSAPGSTAPTSSTAVSTEVVSLHGIDFLNPQSGWLIADVTAVTASSTDYFVIFSTTDGGASWSPIYETETPR